MSSSNLDPKIKYVYILRKNAREIRKLFKVLTFILNILLKDT